MKAAFIRSLLFFPTVLVFAHNGYNQNDIGSLPFYPEETMKLQVSYNLGFIWLDAGEVLFSSDTSQYQGKEVINLYSFGTSYQIYDFIFTVRDRFMSMVDLRMEPIRFREDILEGRKQYTSDLLFDDDGSMVRIQREDRDGKIIDTSMNIRSECHDALSTVYYLRSLDLDQYECGDTINVCLFHGSEEQDLTIVYHGKEEACLRGGQSFYCHKLSTRMFGGTIFREGEKINAWVTADRKKIPVLVEAAILVGSVKVYLKNYNDLELSPD